MVYLVFKAGNSKKVYEIIQNDTEIYIKYGRIGSDGISIQKSFNTSDSASNFLINTVNEKVKKGYLKRSNSIDSFDGVEEERKRKFTRKSNIHKSNYGKLTQSDESGIGSEDEAENLTSVDQSSKPTIPEANNHKTFHLVNNSSHINPLFYKLIINNSTVEVIHGSLNDHKVISNEIKSFATNALASKFAYSRVSNFLIANYVLSSAEAVECVDLISHSNDTGTSSKTDGNKRRKVDAGVSAASLLSSITQTRSSQTADKRKTVGTNKSTSKGKHNRLKNIGNEKHDDDDQDSDDPHELDIARDQLSDYSQESDDGEDDEDNGTNGNNKGHMKPKYEHKPGPTLLFTYKQGNSDKFYEITQCYKTVTCRYGRTGTQGTTITKTFHSEDGADNYVENMCEQKTKKGYVCETTANLGWAHYCVIC